MCLPSHFCTRPLTWCRRSRRPRGRGRFSCPRGAACMWRWGAATGSIAAASHPSQPAPAAPPCFHRWGRCRSWGNKGKKKPLYSTSQETLTALRCSITFCTQMKKKKITWMWGSPWRSWPTFEASKPWSPSTECERGPRPLVWSQDDWSWGGVQLRLGSTLLKEALC